MMALDPAKQGPIPPHWLPYAMVDDCDATLEKVARLGGNVFVPGTTIENVGRFAVFCDPTGATIAMIQLEGK
jgi:hypothetical protein